MSVNETKNEKLHPETEKLVDELSAALKTRLLEAQIKNGRTDDWMKDDWEEQCRSKIHRSMERGEPLSAIAYLAFMWKRGWNIRG